MRAPTVLPTPARPFGVDTLACALALTGQLAPTAAALATALAELYPGGGPTVPDLLAAGWLVPTVDGRGLRQPPLTPAELDARLTPPELLRTIGAAVGYPNGKGGKLC